MQSCRLCDAPDPRVVYQGGIRQGRFGSLDPRPNTVLRCARCDAAFLAVPPEVDYESAEYRDLVDGSAAADGFYALHDPEQAEKLSRVGSGGLRGRTVADVGCGAGSFLDLVRGVASATLAVEPTRSYHETLRSKGHRVFSYCSEVPDEWMGRVDLALCFSVVEHVEDPLGLLRDIRRMLRPGGELVLSTPNADDWLLEVLPDDYRPFFYRSVHRWYLSGAAVEHLARAAGFAGCEVAYAHRFDLSNFLLWLRDRRPTGLGRLEVSPVVDAAFRRWLEAEGKSDYIYARLRA